MRTISVFLTFDYELFFRRSGTVDACLITPTEKLLTFLQERELKATFFVDVLHIWRTEETTMLRDDAMRIREQLSRALNLGHHLALHLHPQWLDAVPNGREWFFPSSVIQRLDMLPARRLTDLFIVGSQILNEIHAAAGIGCRAQAFRAGGWCLEPFEKVLAGFRISGIRVDSSIGYGVWATTPTHRFDYRCAPTSPLYRFSRTPLIQDPAGEFIELPVTTFHRSLSEKILGQISRLARSRYHSHCGDGVGIDYMGTGPMSLWRKLRASHAFLCLDALTPQQLRRALRRISARLIVPLAHPKNLSPCMLDCLDLLSVLKNATFLPIVAELLEQEIPPCQRC
ncbi:MAG: hypothetical protein N2255_09520 [Kiritimatiellae bacterium]|nr:hypothetical protein [Kiritimatiellia bacterium]